MANSVFFLNLAWSWVVLVYIGRSWLILVQFCKSLLILLVFGWSYFILAYLSWTSLGNTGYSGNLVLHDPVGEKSERKKKKWETSYFWCPKPRPTTPAAYVWYIYVFIIERQMITKSWYILTTWHLIHYSMFTLYTKGNFYISFS